MKLTTSVAKVVTNSVQPDGTLKRNEGDITNFFSSIEREGLDSQINEKIDRYLTGAY